MPLVSCLVHNLIIYHHLKRIARTFLIKTIRKSRTSKVEDELRFFLLQI